MLQASLTDGWSPEEGRYWGEIELSNLADMIEDPVVAYVARCGSRVKNDNARTYGNQYG